MHTVNYSEDSKGEDNTPKIAACKIKAMQIYFRGDFSAEILQ
jgi:hypothetical protein